MNNVFLLFLYPISNNDFFCSMFFWASNYYSCGMLDYIICILSREFRSNEFVESLIELFSLSLRSAILLE